MSVVRKIPTTVVADLAALAAEPVGVRRDGFLIYVRSLRSYFSLERASSLAPDGITAIAGRGVAGSAWVRLPIAHPAWAQIADWYINATTGDDENDGQSDGTALRTFAELSRRWGDNTIDLPAPNVGGTHKVCTVNIRTSLTNDPISHAFRLGPINYVCFRGAVDATLQSGTFTAVVAKNPAANQPVQLTDSALATSNAWAATLGHRIRVTSGSNTNATAWVAKDLGAKQARISDLALSPQLRPDYANDWPAISGMPTSSSRTPNVGDSYVVERMVHVVLGCVALFDRSTAFGVLFTDLDISANSSMADSPMRTATFWNCRFSSTTTPPIGGAANYINCCFVGGSYSFGGMQNYIYGGLSLLSGNQVVGSFGGRLVIDADHMVQGGHGVRGSGLVLSSVGVFDAISNSNFPGGAGVTIGGTDITGTGAGSAVIRPGNGSPGRVWGSGNAGPGMLVNAGSLTIVSTSLASVTITGSSPGTNDFALAGSTTVASRDDATGTVTTDTASWANLKSAYSLNGQAEYKGAAIREAA